jgi:hypothetical protein
MTNIDKILEASNRVINLRAQLKTAEEELASLAGPRAAAATRAAPARRKPIRGAGPGPTISQRVLNMVLDAGRVGIARRDILAVIPGHEPAVDNALQAHRVAGRIVSDAGQWMATAGYVQQLQAVPSLPAEQRDTRPLRATRPTSLDDAYLAGQG